MRLSVLDDDAFEHVGHVFRAVGRIFEQVERFLPLHHHDRIVLFIEQPHHRFLMPPIGFVLEPVDFDGMVDDDAEGAERVERERLV